MLLLQERCQPEQPRVLVRLRVHRERLGPLDIDPGEDLVPCLLAQPVGDCRVPPERAELRQALPGAGAGACIAGAGVAGRSVRRQARLNGSIASWPVASGRWSSARVTSTSTASGAASRAPPAASPQAPGRCRPPRTGRRRTPERAAPPTARPRMTARHDSVVRRQETRMPPAGDRSVARSMRCRYSDRSLDVGRSHAGLTCLFGTVSDA